MEPLPRQFQLQPHREPPAHMKLIDPVICTRCLAPRWPYGGARPADYICQRCRDVLAGVPNVVDPVRSPAQQAADAVAGARLVALRSGRIASA